MMGKTLRDAARQPISRWLELDALKEAVSWPGASVRPRSRPGWRRNECPKPSSSLFGTLGTLRGS